MYHTDEPPPDYIGLRIGDVVEDDENREWTVVRIYRTYDHECNRGDACSRNWRAQLQLTQC